MRPYVSFFNVQSRRNIGYGNIRFLVMLICKEIKVSTSIFLFFILKERIHLHGHPKVENTIDV